MADSTNPGKPAFHRRDRSDDRKGQTSNSSATVPPIRVGTPEGSQRTDNTPPPGLTTPPGLTSPQSPTPSPNLEALKQFVELYHPNLRFSHSTEDSITFSLRRLAASTPDLGREEPFIDTREVEKVFRALHVPESALYNKAKKEKSGQYASVREADWTPDRVVVKTLKTQRFKDSPDAFRKHFLREMWALQAFRHPNIVHMHGFTTQNNRYGLVLEKLQTTLRDRIAARPLTDADIKEYSLQILNAVDHLHTSSRAPFIHRDLSPDNIMLNAAGVCKIIDLGLARDLPLEGKASPFDLIGLLIDPPLYCAPELATTTHTTSCDMFSFAMVLYYMVEGKDPQYKGEGRPGFTRPVSEDLRYGVFWQRAMVHCWSPDPTKRFTARQLRALVAKVMPGTVVDIPFGDPGPHLHFNPDFIDEQVEAFSANTTQPVDRDGLVPNTRAAPKLPQELVSLSNSPQLKPGTPVAGAAAGTIDPIAPIKNN